MCPINSVPKHNPQLLVISDLQEGQRIDNFLITRLKGLPKSHIYQIIRKGEVRVNKKRIKPDYRLQIGDTIRIPPLRLGTPTKISLPSQNIQHLLDDCVLYEDKNLLIINKPAGMAAHGGSGINFGVIEILRHMHPQERFLELAHRLDKETSGCLLLAKKPSLLKELHHLLREGLIEKRYLALVKGYWPKRIYTVDVPLQKYQLRSGERLVDVNATGKPSSTEFRIIQRFADATLIEAKPQTGRTHQIRVHAAYLEHPIIGDEKYGDKNFNKQFRIRGCKRLFLHASDLNFILPSTKEHIKVHADLEAELQACLDSLKSI